MHSPRANEHSRHFSSRKHVVVAPWRTIGDEGSAAGSTCNSTCFPKRDELLLATICALPSASSTVVDASTPSRTALARAFASACIAVLASPADARHTRYWSTHRIASVLPAPDSPLTSTETQRCRCNRMHAASATAYVCGTDVPSSCARPRKRSIATSPKRPSTPSHGLTESSWLAPTQV